MEILTTGTICSTMPSAWVPAGRGPLEYHPGLHRNQAGTKTCLDSGKMGVVPVAAAGDVQAPRFSPEEKGPAPDMMNRIKYWTPRLLVLGFALSLPFSAPDFIRNMDADEYIIWLLRLIWVLMFPAALLLVLVIGMTFRKFRKK